MYDRFYYDHSTPLQGCGRSFMDFRHVHSTRSASQLLGLNTFSRRTTTTFVFMPNLTPNRKARTKICIEIHAYTDTFTSDTHTDRQTHNPSL